MSNLGVFHWIRDAVRRSVLLGFSDAVEQLGVPDEENGIHPELLASLRQLPARESSSAAIADRPAKTERRRLGRSLEQIRGSGARSTETPDA
jgi:hypothetical protein